MGIIINGVGIGFFAAIFISMYAQNFLNYIFPFWLIFGILAPLFAAISIFLLMTAKKDKKDVQWYSEPKDE